MYLQCLSYLSCSATQKTWNLGNVRPVFPPLEEGVGMANLMYSILFGPFSSLFWLAIPTTSNLHLPTLLCPSNSLIKERLASKGERASNFHELKREPSVSTDLGESWTVIVQKGQTALLPNIHTHTHTHKHTQQKIRANAVGLDDIVHGRSEG